MEFTVFQQLSKIPAGWLVGDFQQASVYSGTAWYPVSQQGGKTGLTATTGENWFLIQHFCNNKEAQVKML